MIDLLNQFHLSDRYNTSKIQSNINWEKINDLYMVKRQIGRDFLLNAIRL